jgi:hypothetical protein
MTDELNVFESTQWERSFGPVRGARLGPDIGARDLGCSLYELDPGARPRDITPTTPTRSY